ncbi:pseudaminic acid synthase [candidate division WS5 bacterium]|uniref:Pseudaminic acid synthase n=1 Tax=candidate division WS5 bacterium TaxID=2093353 RepID=A0A419DFH0_9BACT|nr:MAG: pseudaminic acid synthase [candidate division WS5 bacterium]
MKMEFMIGNRKIGKDHPVYIIAEMSANHNQNFDQAVKLIHSAKEAGVDAVKLQTYTSDTITIDCDNEYFCIGKDTLWEGQNIYELYKETYTPWDWQPRLKSIANDIGMDLFSTPFDKTAVDFLEKMDVPAYKIASAELIDIPLISYIAKTGKPIIMSTGMATLSEIDEAVRTIQNGGGNQIALLKCTSAYPAMPEEMNLRTIPHMAEAFGLPVGLSDHTLGIAVPVAATALGACIVEKHFTLSRSIPGPDSAFSLEPHEFKAMVDAIRISEKALGKVRYEVTEKETASRAFRRSIFAVKNIKAGDLFSNDNIRSIRPGHGLHTRYFNVLIGRISKRDIQKGTPIDFDMVG